MRPTPPSRPNTILLAAVALGVALLLVLLVSLITHRTNAPRREGRPSSPPPTVSHEPFAPVYGGGASPGRRRGGF